jgi:BirA family biotin operon repressor/biotin-[acetyl-CoA-carboxylase] ligase
MALDVARIAGSGLVAQIDYHESLGSTSDRALEIGALGEAELPLLVLTEQQTAGRGRSTNRWLTTEGALTFSLVLEAPADRLPPSRWPQIALVAGVAVADALSRFVSSDAVCLKWPNDIYLRDSRIGERKAGGILSESVPGWRDRLVIGIGINVNNRIADTNLTSQTSGLKPASLGGSALSLAEFDGVERDLTDVLIAVLDEFDRRWAELIDDGFDRIAAAYRGHCLLTGKTVTIQQREEESIRGVCRGIDSYGSIVLRTPNGEKSVISGTVVGWE